MTRKINTIEESSWHNPLKSTYPRPYLGDEIWPDDPRDPKWDLTIEILKKFYCPIRDQQQDNIDKLRIYLENPEKYMIIWGDVGIGKTWFIRYELLAGNNSMGKMPYHAGIIDMLSEKDTEYGVYKQLRYVIEMYFERFCTCTIDAINAFIRFDYARLKLKSPDQLTKAELEDVNIILTDWLEMRNGITKMDIENYAIHLLDVLQHVGKNELMILVVDNIDKTRDEEQEQLVKLAVRILRNPQIRLIIPLRRSSALLRDRFSVLKEFSYEEMDLTPLDIREMLKVRFQSSREGANLSTLPRVMDSKDGKEYTFPAIYNLIFGKEKANSEAGNLLLTIAASNARESLALTERLLYSDQIKGLRNIVSPEYIVAALMLSDTSQPFITSCILNLFDDEDPSFSGNGLIRFRVLEYFWNVKKASISDQRFQDYFLRLGYDLARVKKVLELFMMTQLLISPRGLSLESFRTLSFDEIGSLEITKSGTEFKNLLQRMWYFVSVKRDVYLPENLIKKDVGGREYCTHTDFENWLRDQEEKEKRAINEYTRVNGEFKLDWGLIHPSKIAKQALRPQNEVENNGH
jgi:hypothetical protein